MKVIYIYISISSIGLSICLSPVFPLSYSFLSFLLVLLLLLIATQYCFDLRETFKQEVLAIVIQHLVDTNPIPPLFMRTVIYKYIFIYIFFLFSFRKGTHPSSSISIYLSLLSLVGYSSACTLSQINQLYHDCIESVDHKEDMEWQTSMGRIHQMLQGKSYSNPNSLSIHPSNPSIYSIYLQHNWSLPYLP